ncbi:hypothetical protein MesoLjLa_04610 [Mesorhizobium sp. L-2-11]|nr:hypothetical protein MesoLjLa_04610 [Mesorhizobium sp. L-2-11]
MTTLPDPARFAHVTDWVFDLDNTLYPHHSNLFAQIDVKMTSYVEELLTLPRDDARKLQKELYREYGTTLNGLMARHGIDPDDFLEKVHDIDYSPMATAGMPNAPRANSASSIISTTSSISSLPG